jgi:hypothetical protein
MSNNLGKRLFRVAAALATGVTVVVLAGCNQTSTRTAQSTSTLGPTVPITSYTPTPPLELPPQVASALGPPPANCAKAAPAQTLTIPNFGFMGTVTFRGGSPAWELGVGTDGVLAVAGTPYPSTKIMWVVGPNVNQPVTLTGHDLRSGKPLWFEVYPSNNGGGADYFTKSAVLDPAAPNRGSADNSAGHWNIWGIGIIATAAGCYQFDVTSSAGSWRATLAVGSMP